MITVLLCGTKHLQAKYERAARCWWHCRVTLRTDYQNRQCILHVGCTDGVVGSHGPDDAQAAEIEGEDSNVS